MKSLAVMFLPPGKIFSWVIMLLIILWQLTTVYVEIFVRRYFCAWINEKVGSDVSSPRENIFLGYNVTNHPMVIDYYIHIEIFARRYFCEFGSDISRVFIFVIVQRELHIVEPIGPMSKLTIVAIHQSLAHLSLLEMS